MRVGKVKQKACMVRLVRNNHGLNWKGSGAPGSESRYKRHWEIIYRPQWQTVRKWKGKPWFSDLHLDTSIKRDRNVGGGVYMGTMMMNSILNTMWGTCEISVKQDYLKGNKSNESAAEPGCLRGRIRFGSHCFSDSWDCLARMKSAVTDTISSRDLQALKKFYFSERDCQKEQMRTYGSINHIVSIKSNWCIVYFNI